jgi:hypothetical protein
MIFNTLTTNLQISHYKIIVNNYGYLFLILYQALKLVKNRPLLRPARALEVWTEWKWLCTEALLSAWLARRGRFRRGRGGTLIQADVREASWCYR